MSPRGRHRDPNSCLDRIRKSSLKNGYFYIEVRNPPRRISQLFKRLNSYSKQHPLYKALKEFGKIVKTIFILRYIDDVEFRQAIEKQLNKIESSNKFSKAVALGNSQKFAYGEKVEQEIAEGCRRLIKNAIVCWNYMYLSQKIAEEDESLTSLRLKYSCAFQSLLALTKDSISSWSGLPQGISSGCHCTPMHHNSLPSRALHSIASATPSGPRATTRTVVPG